MTEPPAQMGRAIQLLQAGRLVAFPTETVYGLGADATNADAVNRIFTAKGRPATNPLICHVADETVARRYAREWSAVASRLAAAFWPGPLTLVVKKTDEIVPSATAGLDSVGLRAPNHPLTLELLRGFDGPVAGPSANKSNRISPTTAEHVRQELGDAVDLILDGGACTVGIESTVLDITRDRPMILRPGGISREQIELCIGPVDLFSGAVASTESAISPGQQAVHYAPRTPAVWFETRQRGQVTGEKQGLMILSPMVVHEQYENITLLPNDPEQYARLLYAELRRLDAMRLLEIAIEMPPDEPKWSAVRDRISRAARKMEERPVLGRVVSG